MTYKKAMGLGKNELLAAIQKCENEIRSIETLVNSKAKKLQHIQSIRRKPDSFKMLGRPSTSEAIPNWPSTYTSE